MKYWSSIASRISPYIPGEQPQDGGYIKLNTNENPYPPSPRALAAIAEAACDDLRLYPDPDCLRLRRAFSSVMDVASDEVFVGNGSDEVLAVAFQAFFDAEGPPIFFPDISYSFYPVYADLYRIPYKQIPLREDFSINPADYLTENGGIILSNPNAPTSRALSAESIIKMLEYNQKIGRVVIVDEAYIAFGGESMVPYIHEFDNLIVTMTLSKSYALAGLRGGFALTQKGLVEALDRIKNSFNSYTLDRLAIAGAAEAVLDEEHFKTITQRIISTREHTAKTLHIMGFEVLPSSANFLFVKNNAICGEMLYNMLKARGILIRHFNRPRIVDWVRITVGREDEMETLLAAISDTLGAIV